jgi:hypothetical protein
MKPIAIRTEILAGEGPNGEDLIKTVDGQTGAIINVEILTTDPDGKEITMPLPSKKMATMVPTEPTRANRAPIIPTVEDMILLAEEMKRAASDSEVLPIISQLLENCKRHVLEGNFEYTFSESSGPSSKVIAGVIKHLKELGYKVKKAPTPGVGTWIKISWPTSSKKSQKLSKEPPVSRPQLQTQKPLKKHLMREPDSMMTMEFKEKKPS